MMARGQLDFLVQGSSSDPYEVTFLRDGRNLTALCTCAAGSYGQHCKHRIGLLTGQTKGLVSDNRDDVTTLLGWVDGTDVAEALTELAEAEAEAKAANAKLKAAKKKLARVMMD